MKHTKTMDGNEAAAYVAYAFTEVAAIYPITPSSPMAELTDEWAAAGRKNLFGQTVNLVEMQSEAGAAGAVHGALEAGALATSYTASQGLMLMIPAMHRISGQRHPGVLHVASRTVGTHAFSIFGDHSDVMNCRQTGFAMLSTGSVQEVMDLAGVAHLAAIEGSIPFLHFFDGFRTSHEIQKIECIDYEDFRSLLNMDAVEAFRRRALNPEHPVMRSTVQNPDVYFQVREANNGFYRNLPDIVESYMQKIGRLTGREYHLFDYYGAPDARRLIIAMGSVSGTVRETVEDLNRRGEKVGFLQVHLYRPFSPAHMLAAIPESVERIAVLDRVKELGAPCEPLCEDVCAVWANHSNAPFICGGRYGLSSKDTTPAQIKAVYDNLACDSPKNNFVIGITDDVTGLSLDEPAGYTLENPAVHNCKFWGLGSDGTVGANKNSIKIIGEHTDMYTQAYFEYDTKKSFGVTKSHLRFGTAPILSTSLVKRADFIACHNQTYLQKYDILSELKNGGAFLLNCDWTEEQLEHKLPAAVKRSLAEKDARFYIIDAAKAAEELGLGGHSNMILQAAFFQIASIIDPEEAIQYMKEGVVRSYGKKGQDVVDKNMAAIDRGASALMEVKVPASWRRAAEEQETLSGAEAQKPAKPAIIERILEPINAQKGDDLPVSAFVGLEDGTMPPGTSAYEKRGIATHLPLWDPDACLQCNRCSLVCPHAAIRPFLLSEEEAAMAPAGFLTRPAKDGSTTSYRYTLQLSAADCTSCGNCADVCPAKGGALHMRPVSEIPPRPDHWTFALTLSEKAEAINFTNVKGSQFRQPLLEFSGACAGCGETPYIKLLTQMFGDKMYIANGTGCSQAWGAAMPCVPYTTDKTGRGPAWSNSLFENNAEFSLGMFMAINQQRNAVRMKAETLLSAAGGFTSPENGDGSHSELRAALKDWLDHFDDLESSRQSGRRLVSALKHARLTGADADAAAFLLRHQDQLAKKTVWMVGGDGWAYDIGFGGLDHVFSSGEDLNVLVVDTEVYSNTGGQSSKATPLGAVAQFAASGKKSRKKDLGMLMMSYGNVYVAQVSMGADPVQLLKALDEAQRYRGPSLVIAYAPCVNHGIKAGMKTVQREMKRAVDAGYWHLYRYNPDRKERPFILDSKEPTLDYMEFLKGEVRYSSLELTFPENARELFAQADTEAKEKYERYKALSLQSYNGGTAK